MATKILKAVSAQEMMSPWLCGYGDMKKIKYLRICYLTAILGCGVPYAIAQDAEPAAYLNAALVVLMVAKLLRSRYRDFLNAIRATQHGEPHGFFENPKWVHALTRHIASQTRGTVKLQALVMRPSGIPHYTRPHAEDRCDRSTLWMIIRDQKENRDDDVQTRVQWQDGTWKPYGDAIPIDKNEQVKLVYYTRDHDLHLVGLQHDVSA